MLNSEFLTAVYGDLVEQYGWICSFRADPNDLKNASWAGSAFTGHGNQCRLIDARPDDNNFFCVAVMKPGVGKRKRSKENFLRLAALVADDIRPEDMISLPSYEFETSPGNYQIGMILDPLDHDCADAVLVDRLMQVMAENKMCKADASGNNIVRYVRLPNGTNTKAKHNNFKTVVRTIDAEELVYNLADAAAAFGINLDAVKRELPELSLEKRVHEDKIRESSVLESAKIYSSLMNPIPAQRDYHQNLLQLSASLVASGMNTGAVVNHLRGMMLSIQPDPDLEPDEYARHDARMAEIVRMTMGAAQKFAPLTDVRHDPIGLIRSASDIHAAAKNANWLVKGLIPADAMGMIFGASGTFKSFVALDLLMHIAYAERWLGRKTVNGPIVYLAAEGGAGVARRLDAWRREHGTDDFNDRRVNLVATPMLLSQEDEVDALRDAIALMPEKPMAVVIDTMSQTFSGDENSSTDVAHYLRLLNARIRAIFGCTVIIVHHTGHNVTERPRGSSALTANLDFMYSVARPSKGAMFCQMECIKQKDGDKPPLASFKLDRHVVDLDEDGDEVSSLVATFYDEMENLRGDNPENLKLNTFEMAILELFTVAPEGVVPETEMREVLKTMVPTAGRNNYWRRMKEKMEGRLKLIRPHSVGNWIRHHE
tara:strand:- start:419 stop:2383 length:1965 start_codon:yes stop_codon:yes gene_type:complete